LTPNGRLEKRTFAAPQQFVSYWTRADNGRYWRFMGGSE